ncbi:hypothetical protein EVAR_36558_1 [Eumeta japonica]|uniref:Uncharacterized protein n=1 Tax=Eumeta variegata TaxID=151549 RepID=A0A4C1XYV1_EUMVA|nr:hypothetical protein EVAR_36558_1 [Eumeta japonica]
MGLERVTNGRGRRLIVVSQLLSGSEKTEGKKWRRIKNETDKKSVPNNRRRPERDGRETRGTGDARVRVRKRSARTGRGINRVSRDLTHTSPSTDSSKLNGNCNWSRGRSMDEKQIQFMSAQAESPQASGERSSRTRLERTLTTKAEIIYVCAELPAEQQRTCTRTTSECVETKSKRRV